MSVFAFHLIMYLFFFFLIPASAYVPGQSSSKSGFAKPTFKHIPKVDS